MQEIAPAPDTVTPEQILASPEGRTAIEEVIRAGADPENEYNRTLQINKAKRQWLMVKGHHFCVPGMVDTPNGQIAEYVGWESGNVDRGGAAERANSVINLIGGDCYKFMAVMGNSAPRVKAVADDPRNHDNLKAAQDSDAIVRDLWVKWKADQKQRVLAFHQYTTGPVFGRTVWVTDGRKYGRTTEPKIDLQPGPDGAPVPVDGGVQQYDNGDVELHLYTILEVEVPYMCKGLDEVPLFKLEVMQLKWDLLSTYAGEDGKPGPLDKYRDQDVPDDDASASSHQAAEAREAVSTPSGLGRQRRRDHWRHREYWAQPFLFEAITNDTLRGIFKRQFADGLYIAKVGSLPVKLDNRKCTDEWGVCKTGRGEKILEDAIATDAVSYQLAIDDLMNMAQETVLRAIAQTIVDSSLIDREAMSKKEAIAGELILTMLPVDGDIGKRIAQIQPSRVSDQLVPLVTTLRAFWQDNTGIRPELSGSGPPTATYREAKQRKDQALLQISPQSQEMDYFWTKIGENGVKMRAKYGSGTVSSPRKGSFGPETDVVDMAELQDSGWHCESDDNFPMSSADRFDKMWAIMKEFPPEVQQALSILDPINLEEVLELLQIPGFESTVEDQKSKTLGDIMALLQGQPVDGPPGPDGKPGPKQPSIPIDDYDDHQFIKQFVPKWMVSKTGQTAKNGNPAGFENVDAFWQAHSAAAEPPQPPPPPAVKAALNVSAKLEDMGPAFTNEVLQGVGLPPNMPAPPPPAPPPPGGISAPPPVDAGGEPPKPAPGNALPEMAAGPAPGLQGPPTPAAP